MERCKTCGHDPRLVTSAENELREIREKLKLYPIEEHMGIELNKEINSLKEKLKASDEQVCDLLTKAQRHDHDYEELEESWSEQKDRVEELANLEGENSDEIEDLKKEIEFFRDIVRKLVKHND